MKFAMLIFAMLLAAPAAFSQLQLTAGGGNLFGSGGMELLYAARGTQTDVGIGVVANRVVYGADFRFKKRACTTALGDFSEYLGVEGEGVSVANRGVAFECDWKHRKLRFFTGDVVGSLKATPYLTATGDTGRIGAGISFQQEIQNFEIDLIASRAGSQRAYLQSVKYSKKQNFTAAESAGYVLNRLWYQANADLRTRHFGFDLQHADFVALTSYTAEGVTVGTGGLNVFGSAFQSPTNAGEAAGVNFSRDFLTANFYELFSKTRESVLTVTEKIPFHISLNQLVAYSRDASLNFSGGYQGNTISASLGYGIVFNPLAGFQKALTLSCGLQLPRLTLHANLEFLPSGLTYVGWGTAYIEGASLSQRQTVMAE